jgi:hypothetical protein
MIERRMTDETFYGRSCRKLWYVIIIILVYILMDSLLKYNVQEMKRSQARYNLEQIKYCYKNIYDVVGKLESLGVCTNKSKTSYTGDVYILDADTLEFIHETSRDIPRNEVMYFTKESIGKYFKDWESADKAFKIIMLGKNSEYGVNVSYNFDGDIEWLEWIFLPNEFGKNRMIAVQGTQQDEVMLYLAVYRYSFMFLTAIFVFFLLVSHKRRRINDNRRCLENIRHN